MPQQRDASGHHSIGLTMFDVAGQPQEGSLGRTSLQGDSTVFVEDSLFLLNTALSRGCFAELLLKALLATYLAGSACAPGRLVQR